MICYCTYCHHVFNASIRPRSSKYKNGIPSLCPKCRKKVWVDSDGNKVPTVRLATEEEKEEYYQFLKGTLEEVSHELIGSN